MKEQNTVSIEKAKLWIINIEAILMAGKLSKAQKSWLQRQRKKYNKNPKLFPKETQLLLDTLTPLLGYDWRNEKEADKRMGHFKALEQVLEDLKNGRSLTKKQKVLIASHRSNYNAKPTSFPKETLARLNELNSFLGYDWKEKNGSRNHLVKKFTEEIYSVLEQDKTLAKNLRIWLTKNQQRYNADPKAVNEYQINCLDKLTPLLGCDWRVYKKKDPNEVIIPTFDLLKEALEKELPLSEKIVNWLHKQRAKYRDSPEKFNLEDKKALDDLIPLLGYEWKENKILKLSFDERIKSISKELKKNSPLNKSNLTWLYGKKRNYHKNPDSLTATQLKKLEQLEPLLGRAWDTNAGDKKPVKYYVDRIKALNSPYDLLPKKEKRWLKEQRYQFNRDASAFTNEEIELLDSLTPITKRSWNAKMPSKKYKELMDYRIQRLEEKLKRGEELDRMDISYLIKKKNHYLKKTYVNDAFIEKLDALIPLMGFDWKKGILENTFEEKVTQIKDKLKITKKISEETNRFLTYHGGRYRKYPNEYPEHKKSLLDELIPLLGRDWKELRINASQPIPFEKRVKIVMKNLKKDIAPTYEEECWLRRHRTIYKKDPKGFDKKRLLLLDKLNPLLAYDWKIPVWERKRNEELNKYKHNSSLL